jgi:hypothetical protein
MTTDGQLWIGSSSSNRSNNGGHVRLGSLASADGSVTVTTGPGTIDLAVATQQFSPNAVLQEFDDFLGTYVGSDGIVSKLRWQNSPSPWAIAGTTDNPGILSIRANAGESWMMLENEILGGGEVGDISLGGGVTTISWTIKLSALSAGGNTYRISFGLADGTTILGGSDSFVDGIYFQYTNAVNGGQWTINNTNTSVTTTGNTSNTADTDFHTFAIVANAAATSIAYYIDNVQVANSPLTTDIPTASIAPFVYVHKIAGTHPEIEVDLFSVQIVLTNPRPGPSPSSGSHGTLIETYRNTAISTAITGTDAIVGVTDTSAPRTLTMPAIPAFIGQRWTLKDESGGAAANNITVDGNGNNIDGAATFPISTNYGSVDIYWSGTAYFII